MDALSCRFLLGLCRLLWIWWVCCSSHSSDMAQGCSTGFSLLKGHLGILLTLNSCLGVLLEHLRGCIQQAISICFKVENVAGKMLWLKASLSI